MTSFILEAHAGGLLDNKMGCFAVDGEMIKLKSEKP